MSKYIKSESVKFKVSKVVYALIAAVAASATLTAHTEERTTRNWTGGTGTADAPKDLWDYANWDGEGNFYDGNTVDCYLSVTDTTYLNSANGANRFCCDLVPNAGDFVFSGPLQFHSFKPGSAENSTVSILKKSGDWSVATFGMYIGNASGTKATFVNESGNITSTKTSYGVHIGCVPGATGIVENVSGNWTIEGNMYLCQSNNTAATFVNESGNVTLNDINFGIYDVAGGTGTLTIKGGTVTLRDGKKTIFAHGEGTINLDGGSLTTGRIERNGKNGSLVQNINFNGGTLKASAADDKPFIYSQYGYMYVTVGAGGGTIDCNGFPITLDLNTYKNGTNNGFFKGDGGLTFTGGNTITINNNVTYAGVTRVTPGTTLAITDARAKDNILSHGLVVAGVPTAGQKVFTYTSALDDGDLTNVSCPYAPATTFKFSDEGKTNIVVDVVGSPDWTEYSHKFRMSFSGYTGSETLANFPVLVKISETGISGFRYADCKKPGGADLRFADESGNLLASEVDTWDTNGVSLVWVKVPSLNKNTVIKAYYGWDIAPEVDSSAVWTGNGYVGVWHLNEDAVPLRESSGVSAPFMNNGANTNKVTFAALGVAGGKSVSFAANYDTDRGTARLQAADDDGHLSGFTDFTVECWTYQTDYLTGGTGGVLEKENSDNRSWRVGQYSGAGPYSALYLASETATNALSASKSAISGEWTHQTFVRNKTDLNKCLIYFNGVNIKDYDDGHSSLLNSNTQPLTLGGGGNISRIFPGSIDEVRISTVARSADWVKASHDTVTESSFATYDPAGENVDKGMMIFVR